MPMNHLLEDFDNKGITVVPDVINAREVQALRKELKDAIDNDAVNFPDAFDKGMVHNCMFRGSAMAKLLDNPKMNQIVSKILGETFIIYAYQSSSLNPGNKNYGSRVHVDSPRFIDSYSTNVGVIFALDDFTLENGATYYLEGSHKSEQIAEDEAFYETAQRGVCKAGDLIVFNGRLVHAAGFNNSDKERHSLTINCCRSFMRQRFDFAKMLVKQNRENDFSDNAKKLMGWNVRMPSDLAEFYLPADQRLYKPNQG
ncbi:MAG: ectoine hydroxylase-related dioxygenase (phytanoyl-CoA dioxygenase family) [Phenylobacterium sp.]|jgi:ectoine hydroxylase-related dioxygenase (phytanoyl-CoA dioxygenase family)